MPNSQVIAECNKLVHILDSEDYSIFSRKYKIDGDKINILYTARMFITSDNASDNTDHIKVLCGYITELSDILFRMNALAPDYHARLRAIYNRLHHYVTVNDQAPYHPILASTKVCTDGAAKFCDDGSRKGQNKIKSAVLELYIILKRYLKPYEAYMNYNDSCLQQVFYKNLGHMIANYELNSSESDLNNYESELLSGLEELEDQRVEDSFSQDYRKSLCRASTKFLHTHDKINSVKLKIFLREHFYLGADSNTEIIAAIYGFGDTIYRKKKPAFNHDSATNRGSSSGGGASKSSWQSAGHDEGSRYTKNPSDCALRIQRKWRKSIQRPSFYYSYKRFIMDYYEKTEQAIDRNDYRGYHYHSDRHKVQLKDIYKVVNEKQAYKKSLFDGPKIHLEKISNYRIKLMVDELASEGINVEEFTNIKDLFIESSFNLKKYSNLSIRDIIAPPKTSSINYHQKSHTGIDKFLKDIPSNNNSDDDEIPLANAGFVFFHLQPKTFDIPINSRFGSSEIMLDPTDIDFWNNEYVSLTEQLEDKLPILHRNMNNKYLKWVIDEMGINKTGITTYRSKPVFVAADTKAHGLKDFVHMSQIKYDITQKIRSRYIIEDGFFGNTILKGLFVSTIFELYYIGGLNMINIVAESINEHPQNFGLLLKQLFRFEARTPYSVRLFTHPVKGHNIIHRDRLKKVRFKQFRKDSSNKRIIGCQMTGYLRY